MITILVGILIQSILILSYILWWPDTFVGYVLRSFFSFGLLPFFIGRRTVNFLWATAIVVFVPLLLFGIVDVWVGVGDFKYDRPWSWDGVKLAFLTWVGCVFILWIIRKR